MPNDAEQYDFFVSYARADNQPAAPGQPGWITAFVEALIDEHREFLGEKARSLVPFFDTEDIRSLDDWQHRLRDGLSASRLFLAFVSPRYFASEWCRREWRAWVDLEIAGHILSSGAAPIYIVEVPGLDTAASAPDVARQVAELCRVPPPHGAFLDEATPIIHQVRQRQLNAVLPFYQDGLAALRKADLRRVLNRLARDLDGRIDQVRRAADSANTVPPYNKRFSGRVEELHVLRQRLTDDRAGVFAGVSGLGGIGKTELVFAYAHAFASVYPGGRFLIPCEGRGVLSDALLKLGEVPDFREQISDQQRMRPDSYSEALVGCLRRRLETHGRLVLILDNVTDLALLSSEQTDQLTAMGPQLHLLATTRLLPPAADRAKWLTLGELPEADATDLLEKHRPFLDRDGGPSKEEAQAARSIVRRLGGFTLAVELIAAWLRAHPTISYVRMNDSLVFEDLEILAKDQGVELRRHNYEKRLSVVLTPVLDSLSPAEACVMNYAALLAPDSVPSLWLKALAEADFPKLAQPRRLSDPWEDLWGRLLHLALFSRADNSTLEAPNLSSSRPGMHCIHRVHRLVQDLVLSRVAVEERQKLDQALERFIKERSAVLERTTSWQEARWEIECLHALARRWDEEQHEETAWLLRTVGESLNSLGEWSRAEEMMRRALALDELRYGSEHPVVATDLNNLGDLLKTTNRLEEGAALMLRALVIDETVSGPEHPAVARDLSNLALLLKSLDRLEQAESLMRRALAIDEAGSDPVQSIVATRLSNLASLLMATDRPEEAEPLIRRALAIDLARHGPEHPKVAIRLNNLAVLLKDSERLEEAEPLLRRALAIDEASYGPEHPEIATDLNSLASILMATDRPEEAEPLLRRAMEIDEIRHGPEHPTTAVCLNNLAAAVMASDRPEEAEALIQRALKILLRVGHLTGHQHPGAHAVAENYAEFLLAKGQSMEQVLESLDELGGEFGISFRPR